MERRVKVPCKTLLLFAALCAAASGLRAEATRIIHTPPPPSPAGVSVEILFSVAGDDAPVAADLFVRTKGGGAYERIAAEERRGLYRAQVPPRLVEPPGFEYFLLARTGAGIEITSPARDARNAPHEVAVLSREALDRIVILSPEPDEIVEETTELIVSVLFDPPLLPGATAILYVDGVEIDEGIERTEDYLIYRAPGETKPGAHEAVAVLIDEAGGSAERRWTFFYREAGGRPLGISLTGKAEAGWALVENRSVEGDPFLPYEATSSLLFDLYAFGDWRGRSVYLSASRDPIYDAEIRAAGRVSGAHLTVEAGDIYPSFSEMTVSWLSGEGANLSLHTGKVAGSLFLVRTIAADTTGGFGTFDQYVGGARAAYETERIGGAINAAYGWESESSVPESLRFLLPITNRVVTGETKLQWSGDLALHVEAGWSATEGDDTTGTEGYRALLTLLDAPAHTLSIEYHDYRPGYYALGSPTVDSGERGVLVDGSIRIGALFRQTAKVEVYDDRESAQEIEEGGKIFQLYGRSDFDWNGWGTAWNTYLLFRTYEIPYVSDRYTSRYGTAGLYGQRGPHTLSLSATASESRSSSTTRSWSGSGYMSGTLAGGAFTWKVGERYALSESREDTTGSGIVSPVSEQTRWTFSGETLWRKGGFDWSARYERIDEKDPLEEDRFTQHLVSLLVARRF